MLLNYKGIKPELVAEEVNTMMSKVGDQSLIIFLLRKVKLFMQKKVN